MKKIPYYIKSYLLLVMILFPYFILYADPIVVSGGSENDYESWILRLNDGRLMVVFDRNPDWESGDLYVTFSTDNGDSWDAVMPIIADFGDQATLSFQQLPGDTIRLWYASNESGIYRIYSAYSLNGLDWTREGQIDLGWEPYFMYYDPTVILEPDSSLTMSYVVSALGGYIAHCPYGGTWDTLKTRVGPDGYRARVMKHDNGTYLYAYHRELDRGQDVYVRASTDRVNWSDTIRLTYNLNSHDPFPNQTPDGAYLVYYAKYEPPAYNLYRRRSYNIFDWETEEQITFDPTNNTQPHFFWESDEIYLIWAHAVTFPYDHDVYFERFSYPGVEETDSEMLQNISMQIYPNPCANQVKIFFNISQIDDLEIALYNVLGEKISNPIRKIDNIFQIDTSNLPNGTYFIKINYPKTQILEKFVVIH